MPTIPEPVDSLPEVIPATEHGGYLVRNLSRPGAFWFVTVAHARLVCGCERGQYLARADADVPGSGRMCRHGRILLAWTADQAKAAIRPAAPRTNVSQFVD